VPFPYRQQTRLPITLIPTRQDITEEKEQKEHEEKGRNIYLGPLIRKVKKVKNEKDSPQNNTH
jgi:hypothetical protein